MYFLGIDLGGTNIASGVVNEKFEIIGRGNVKTRLPRPAEEIADDMKRSAEEAMRNAGVSPDRIRWVGVGTPGAVRKADGTVLFANNLQFRNVPLKAMTEQRLGLPCFIANDANAAAYGEMLAGAGRGTRNFIMITLGTGVGGGVIIDGKIYTGHNDGAGELGHAVICRDGEPCTCGRRGCVEAYASATALIRSAKAAMEQHPESLMWELAGGNLNAVSGRTPFDAMRRGDPAGTRVVDEYLRWLGCAVANYINIFQPEVLAVGGGVGKEGDTILEPLREYARRECYAADERITQIKPALLGNDAGIIGAAMLGLSEGA